MMIKFVINNHANCTMKPSKAIESDRIIFYLYLRFYHALLLINIDNDYVSNDRDDDDDDDDNDNTKR